jgi:hypothetical protein
MFRQRSYHLPGVGGGVVENYKNHLHPSHNYDHDICMLCKHFYVSPHCILGCKKFLLFSTKSPLKIATRLLKQM